MVSCRQRPSEDIICLSWMSIVASIAMYGWLLLAFLISFYPSAHRISGQPFFPTYHMSACSPHFPWEKCFKGDINLVTNLGVLPFAPIVDCHKLVLFGLGQTVVRFLLFILLFCFYSIIVTSQLTYGLSNGLVEAQWQVSLSLGYLPLNWLPMAPYVFLWPPQTHTVSGFTTVSLSTGYFRFN